VGPTLLGVGWREAREGSEGNGRYRRAKLVFPPSDMLGQEPPPPPGMDILLNR